jgi:hypothetical protein
MEGCFHLFTPHDAKWNDTKGHQLMSTGTEDYYNNGFCESRLTRLACTFRLLVVLIGMWHIVDFIDSTGKMPGHPFHLPSAGFSWNEKITANTNQSASDNADITPTETSFSPYQPNIQRSF